MAREVERKFLVKDDSFIHLAQSCKVIRQGYLTGKTENNAAFRVRIIDDKAFITLKGAPQGICRAEFEYPIPVADAEDMLKVFCENRIIEKNRYYLQYEGFTWEIDVFSGKHQGLILAEIELPEENTEFTLPPFIGEEVSCDFKYTNFYLSMA